MYFKSNLNESFISSSFLFLTSNLKNLFSGKIFHNRLTSFLTSATFLLCFAQIGIGQIEQRGAATTNSAGSTNSTSLTINKPTGLITGDVMLLTIVQNETDNDNGGLTSPTLSGWTLVKDILIRSNGTSDGDNAWFGSIYYRVSDGSEGASFSFAMNSRCDMAIGSMVAFSGVAANAWKPDGTVGGPFDIVPASFNNANAVTSTALDVNVASNNSAVVMIAMVNNDRTYSDWSNSRSELFDNTTTTGDDASVGAAWSSCVTSGATGNGTVTLSSSDRNSALILVLRSASVTSAGTASSAPTLCANTTLTNITHITSGTAGIGTATGLPSGVSASWAANTITISGTPSTSGTFNYTIPLSGGCVSASGTIIVTPSPSALTAITSSSTICASASVNLASAATSNNTVSTIAFNGFESVDDWTYTNNTSSGISISTSVVRTGSNSLRFKGSNDNNIDPSITFNTVSLLGYSNIQLSVAFAALDVDTDDDLWLDISYDNGVNWSSTKLIDGWGNFGNGWNTTNTINTTSGVVVNTNPYVLNIPGAETQIAVRIRFNESANDNRNDYYYIDDISISGTPIPAFAWTSSPAGFTSSVQNPTVTPTATTIYTVTATNTYGCSASANTTVTVSQPVLATAPVNGDMIWKGTTSNDWAIIGNWWQYNGSAYVSATAAPTTAQNVIIPKTQTCILYQPNTFANSGNANNLTIETDATLTVGTGTLVVKGNWINNNVFVAGTGTVLFNGITTQTIGGTSQTTFNNLTLNNNHTGVYPSHVALKLLEDATITKTLTLTDGILDVFDKILTLGTSSQKVIISPSIGTADSYVAAHHNLGHTGNVKQFVHTSNIGNGEQYYFPIGDDGKWTPYTLSFNSGTSIASGSTITSHVNDEFIAGSVHASFSDRIKRDWEVNPSVGITNPNYNVQIYHNNDVLESGATATANIIPFKKHGSALFGPVGAFNSPGITQVGTYTASSNSYTWSGITSFSNFGGTAGTISSLPIELISFQANCAGDNQVDVTWSTASEHNTSHFVVEKSRDGLNWTILSTLGAAGNSIAIIEYALKDNNVASGTTYYRLTQFDNDGVSETFNISSVNCGDQQAITSNLVTYPNPSNGSFYIDFYTQDITGPSLISVFDARGVIIYRQDVLVEKGSNVFHIEDLEAAPGMYYIQVSNGTTTSYIVKHSLR